MHHSEKENNESDHIRQILTTAQEALTHNNFFQAIAILTQGITQYPKATELYRSRIQVFLAMQMPQEAEKDLPVLLQEPTLSDLQTAVHIYLNQNKLEDTLKILEDIIATNPDFRDAYILMSRIYVSQHTLDKALAILDKGIQLIPDFALAYKERGGIKMTLHDKGGAMEDLEHAMQLDPTLFSELDGMITNKGKEKPQTPYQI